MIEKALVTGGAGFIGSNLVARLVDDGAEVLVVDDLSRGKLERLAGARRDGRVQVHQLDVRDAALAEVTARFAPDVVFHLAAQIDVRASIVEPVEDVSVNVAGSVNVLEAAASAGATRVVFASSGGAVYGTAPKIPTPETSKRRPESPYGVSKSVVDEYLRYYQRHRGLNFVSLGFSNVYGPRQDPHGEAGVVAIFTGMLLEGRSPTIFGDGSATRDFLYVEDAVDACVRAGSHPGGGFLNIGTGIETSVLDLFRMLRDATGTSVALRHEPARDGEVARSALDPSRARKELGWEPWTPLEEGLEATVAWMRAD